ncbi:MAG TPA: heme-copper oxidase subunit III [Pirellulaceae bacterium]|nr:heme-copper oxidase subunit III [Pirellulaceae bacterium]
MTATHSTLDADHAPRADIGSLTHSQLGMIAFLASEVSFFSTLIVAYLTFLGKDTIGPTPQEALSLPLALLSSVFLLSSSGTIYFAEKALHAGRHSSFLRWWTMTFLLGATFLGGTAYEWYELITEHQLTISRNLFGTTYYTLIGFHGLHVTCGLIAMLIVLGLAWRGQVKSEPGGGVELISWYWHFVDAVWVVVFGVVYIWGR